MSKSLILIDLSRQLADSDRLATSEVYRDAECVISPWGNSGGKRINVNDMLSLEDFWKEQLVFAREVDTFFAARAAKSPKFALIIKGCKVALWDHNLLEAHKWLATLDRVFSGRDLSSVSVALPRAASRNNIYLYEAEGETSGSRLSELLYRRTDFLLDLVRQWFLARGVTNFQTYEVKRDFVGIKLRCAIRVWGMLATSLILHLINFIRHRLRTRVKPQSRAAVDCADIVALTRSSVHSDYLAPAVRKGGIAILIADSFRSYPRNLRASRNLFRSAPSLHLYDLIKIADLFSALSSTIHSLWSVEKCISNIDYNEIYIYGVKISLNQYYKESTVQGFEALLVEYACKRLIGTRPKTVIHCEMFTHHAVYLASRLNLNGGRIHQVAFGTYEMRPTPEFVFGDGMLCFSRDQQRSMVAIGADPAGVLYEGNIHVSDSIADADTAVVSQRLEARTLAYYSQPYLQEVEQALIEDIAAICEAESYRLLIVLHPRDTPKRFEFIAKRANIIENSAYLSDRESIEAGITFACTRTSNVGYFLILRGVPVVNIMPTPQDQLIRQEYFDGYPFIDKTTDILYNILHNMKKSLGDFYRFRSNFINRSYDGLDVNDFVQFLKKRI